MGLKGLLVALVFLFATGVYAMIIGPVIGPLYSMTTTEAVASQGYMGQMVMVRQVALVFVPAILVVGIILYAYAATQKKESFFGSSMGGPPR